MNVASLQLEGLLMAVASVNRALVAKGLLTRDELRKALASSEAAAISDYRVEEMAPANRDAIAFPSRVLLLANEMADDEVPSFSELAKMVGENKQPYNDQR